MNVTLHVTTRCNMKCGYCYAPQSVSSAMDIETARRAVEFAAAEHGGGVGVVFYGGEPLLEKELIYKTAEYCRTLERDGGPLFFFKITTNGLLIDEEFLDFADEYTVSVSLSCDGTAAAHDAHRVTAGGGYTHKEVEGKLRMLLERRPASCVMMTVNRDTVKYYYESVIHLFSLGARYVIAAVNFKGVWDEAEVEALKAQYLLLSGLYEEMSIRGLRFHLEPFETKFKSHISPKDAVCDKCSLGMRQVSIAPDGKIYPCVQFVGDGVSNGKYVIGDVWNGIDEVRRAGLYQESLAVDEDCAACAISARCNCRCGCQNLHATGTITGVHPALCASEQILTRIVDDLGGRLYQIRVPAFIEKHYR